MLRGGTGRAVLPQVQARMHVRAQLGSACKCCAPPRDCQASPRQPQLLLIAGAKAWVQDGEKQLRAETKTRMKEKNHNVSDDPETR